MVRILVVDDETNQRLLLRELLEDDGYEVLEAGDGLAAIATVQKENPDLVLLDINMPGLDGLQVLRRLHDLDHHLPVILNSAYPAYQDQYVSWLADAYLTKSSHIDEIRRTVQNVLIARGILPPTNGLDPA